MLSLKSSSLNLLLEDLESKAAYVLPSTIAVRKSLLKVNVVVCCVNSWHLFRCLLHVSKCIDGWE